MFINVAISLIIPLMLVFLTPISFVLSFSALGPGVVNEIADEGEHVRLRVRLKQGK